jgi:hypothetical protein
MACFTDEEGNDTMQQEIEDSYNQVKVDRLIIRFMDIS